MRGQKRTIEDHAGGKNVLAEAWLDGDPPELVVYLQDFLERPEGANGPDSIEIELGCVVGLTAAADDLGVVPSEVLDTVARRFAGKGAELISWATDLPQAQPWSHVDASGSDGPPLER